MADHGPDDRLLPVLSRAVSRRRFLHGAGVLATPSLLVACGDDDGSPTPTPAQPTAAPPAAQSPVQSSPAASPVASPGGEASQYRPTSVVGTPQPQPAGEASPVASPDASPGAGPATPASLNRLQGLMAISTQLVGGGTLDEARGQQLLALVESDPAKAQALDAMIAAVPSQAAASPVASPAGSPAASPVSGPAGALREEILRFWYLGTYDGQAVEDRAGFWVNLSSWQAVQYTAATSVCKGFGVWASAPA